MLSDIWLYVALTLLLVAASAQDLLKHKISNYITLSGWAIAPLLHLLSSGATGLADSLLGLGLTLAVTFPLFALRFFGAGDVKLMTAIGAFVGIDSALVVLAFIFITGAVYSLTVHIARGTWSETVSRMTAIASLSVGLRKSAYIPPRDETAGIVIPYAVPISLGTLIFFLYRY